MLEKLKIKMSMKSKQSPPQRTQTEQHAPKLSLPPSRDIENNTDSGHKEEAPKPIITVEHKMVITVMDEFDNNLYNVSFC